MKKIIAIDIGGTTIKSGFATFDGALTSITETPSNAAMGAEIIADKVQEIIAQRLATTACAGIAIATAGIVDSTHKRIVYANQNIPDYTGFDFKTLVAQFDLPVAVENDVNAALLGETWHQSYADDVLMLTFGTGIGGSLMLDGHVYRGARFGAGEVGHIRIGEYDFEKQCSTAALVRRAQDKFGHDEIQNGRQLYRLATRSEAVQAFLDQYYEQVAMWLKSLVVFSDVQTVIIGGGISAEPRFVTGISRAFSMMTQQSFVASTQIKAARLRNSAGMIGAVRNFVETEGRQL